MTFIVHISDLHIGGTDFNEDVFFNNVDTVNDLNPDFIIFTGDLTNHGYYAEYIKAMEYIKFFKSMFFSIPGNHDARNLGYETFQKLIGERNWARNLSSKKEKNDKIPYDDTLKKESMLKNNGMKEIIKKSDFKCPVNVNNITLVGLDSSEPDISDGSVGRPQQLWMEEILTDSYINSTFSIVAIHHHVLPIPKTGRERNILFDAGDILKSLTDFEVNMVLSGHKHVPYLWKVENTLFATAGSFSSLKLRGSCPNSFNTYEIEEDHVEAILKPYRKDYVLLGKYEF
ncbi:MAG: metallophosphoesterase [Methanobrevibacter sp.]|jgi:3',5'-cyclic AMP phosphodiesterase CpdA|nr:metallophosphoesterase [Candidatus Methanovirga basalitermitum]